MGDRTGAGCRSRWGVLFAAVALAGTGAMSAGAASAATPRESAVAGAIATPKISFGTPTWRVTIPDGSSPIALSSPNVAELAGGPAAVVGDEAGKVYAYYLASGAQAWTYTAGAPVNSTPSVAPTTAGSSLDTVFVGTGDAGNPTSGGYLAIGASGTEKWFTQETNPSTETSTPHNGVQASMAVGDLQGGVDVVAGSLGEMEYAMTAGSGHTLNGFPWYQADSNYTTPALADLYGNGQTEIVEGGDSTEGTSYGTHYDQGGHLRVLSPTGNENQPEPNGGLICQYTTTQVVQSSPAVGEFFGASSQVGIVFGTGTHWPGAADTDHLIAVNSHCGQTWNIALDGKTNSSPALADVLGNGQLQVIEGTQVSTSTGSVYAITGATGSTIWNTAVKPVIGSVVTVDLGSGYQDVLAPTINGVYVLTGRNGSVLTVLQPYVGFQNSPLVTDDPNGTIGITLAGYDPNGSVIMHYEIAGSNGSSVDGTGAWPQFHLDPSLNGDAGTVQHIEVPCSPPAGGPDGYLLSAADGGIFNFGNLPFCGSTGSITLNAPVVGVAATPTGGGYWEVASDGGLFSFGNAQFYGSMGGKPLNRPIVGMAATATGGGYWEVASDGGLFAFGNAQFYGSMGGKPLNEPIVGMAATPTGGGYWEVAADGGLFAFGNAKFYGSMGGKPLNAPIVGMASDPATGGYWEVAADGGIFSFNATFLGSMGGKPLNAPIVGMDSVRGGQGYRFVAADGGIFSFDAPFFGSMGGKPLNKPIVGMSGF
ncbi:MAG: PQQ-binding-like beta-propeller repeat protein [Actinomycetota bacterium]|nr:PQQ-binding-like beta-propeller repeat protein [Actinomycetota bacterium]